MKYIPTYTVGFLCQNFIYKPMITKFKIFEDINPKDITGSKKKEFDYSIQTIIDGKRDVGFISDVWSPDLVRIEEKGLKVIKTKPNTYIVYKDEKKAKRLFDIASKHDGYLNDQSPEEAREIGELLGYTSKSIEKYVKKRYRKVEDFNNWNNEKPITGWDYGDDKISDIYQRNVYPKNNPLSHKAHSFLVNWSWNDKFLKHYQNNGVKEIDPEIVKELSKYKPNTEVTLYRVIYDLKGELKYSKNKLKSYCRNLDTALGMMNDPGYMEIKTYKPEKILVDTTLIPNYSNLDLIEEVICITGK